MMVAETLSSRRITKFLVLSTKNWQKLIEKTSMTDIAHQLPFQHQLLFGSLMTSVLSLIFRTFLRLCLGTSMPLLREKMSFIAQNFDNLNIITVLGREEHKLSSGITFFATIEP